MSERADAAVPDVWGDDHSGTALRRYRTLVDALGDGLFQLDADGQFVAANDAFAEMAGYDRGALLGEHASLVLSDDALDRIKRERRDSQSGAEVAVDVAIRTDDGEAVPVELRVDSLAADEQGGSVGVSRHRPEREATEAADHPNEDADGTDDETARQLQQYRALTEAASDVIVTIDERSTIRSVNPAVEEVFGHDQEALIGESLTKLMPDDLTGRHREALTRYLRTNERTIDWEYVELPGEHADGSEIPLAVSFGDIEYDGQRYFTGIIRDVTERKEMERELSERERQLSALVDNVPGMVYRCRHERGWPMEIVGDACEEVTGYQAEALERGEIGWGEDVMFEADRDSLWETIQRDARSGETFSETYRIETADGERRWVKDYGRGVFEDGELVAIEGIISDVTERKRLESELDEIYGRISDAVFALDEDWNFTYLNERAHELINPEGDDLIGKNVWDQFPAADDGEFREQYERAMYEQETVSFEEYYPDPLDTWYEVRAFPSETGLSVYFRDVTERREYERQLAESEQRYRTFAEYFPDGIVTLFDHDLNYTLAAGQGFDYIPQDPDDVEGKTFREVWDDDTVDALEPLFQAALDGEERSVELEYVGREWVVRGVPITDERGDVLARMTMAQDITERKERERKLEASNERLEQFAYAASHDLQEPLRMVSSYLGLIEQRYADRLDEDGREFLEFAVDGAERMRDMIDALLEYSRVGAREESFEPVDLDNVLADVREDLWMRVEESDADVEVGPLPTVEGDGSQLRQVFQNLLNNAIEYSGDAPPRVRVSAEREGQQWVVAVHDEGIGIPEEHTDRVFEVYQRLHTHDEHDGTGIGLALSERIVERHGGDIWVESEPEEGSTFYLTLPATESQ
jgi:PAS domain S-box-containing protein